MALSKKLLQLLLPLALLAFGLRLFFVQSLFIDTERFSPVLLRGDYVVGVKASAPQRGDLVTYQCLSRRLCVGRIVGLPGDRLDISADEIMVNGAQKHDRFKSEERDEDAARPLPLAVVVSPDSVYIEGDELGEVLSSQIDSTVTRVLVSIDPVERKLRWARVGASIH